MTHDGNTYSVTSIGYRALYSCSSLTAVTIPSSVISIGDDAFNSCSSLTAVNIPNSVTSIGVNAFAFCRKLTDLTISNSVTSIGDGAFANCWALTSVAIPNSVISIGDKVFVGCTGLVKITVENGNANYDSRENCNAIIKTDNNELISGCKKTAIPSSVTSIGSSAFSGLTTLTSMTIPNSVTSIGNSAFHTCNSLTKLTIPNSVTFIGEEAFYFCSSLTELTIPNSVTSISDKAFYGCSGLEKITVESSNPNYDSRENCNAIIKTDNNELIFGCKNTTIPSSVTSIGNSAFYSCSGLTELTIGNGVTSIGYRAFSDCSGLTKVTIGNSVTSIGEYAFSYCSNLTTLYSLSITPPSIYRSTFDNDHRTTVNVFVPEEALENYKTDVMWKEFQKLQAIDDAATAVTEVNAAEQIQTANGQITVTGLEDGTTVTVYDLSGQQVGSATSMGGQAAVSTGLTAGAAAIVKVGERSVKTVVK